MKLRLVTPLSLSAALLLAPAARAEQVELFPSSDTTIYGAGDLLSNGSGHYFFAGFDGRRTEKRALIGFDIARSVPAGAKITAAALTLTVSRTQGSATTLSLHRLQRAWGEGRSRGSGQEGGGSTATEGDATWLFRQWPAQKWDAAGADFDARVSASLEVADKGSYTWSGPELTEDVQSFLDQPAQNFGWLLLADTKSGSSKRFDSRNHPDGNTPRLVVTFDPPSKPTGACCLPDGSCGLALDPGDGCAGSYLGSATSCSTLPCPELTGACCENDVAATCEVRAKSQCSSAGWQGGQTTCSPNPCKVVLAPFVDALPLPAVATPIDTDESGQPEYRLSMIQTKQKLHRDLPATTVWGFDDGTIGGYPGPTIEAVAGEPIRVTWVNNLRDESGEFLTEHALEVDHCLHGAHAGAPRTVVHLHGGRVPAEFDGQPELTLLPGEETTYVYPNDQRAATIWYHDHALGITRLNVVMGLAGFYLIRDKDERRLRLPSGKYEIPIVIQDRSFNPDGSLLYPAKWRESFFGNTPVVNGKASPYLDVDRGKYRFRLLNGSTSRVYALSLSSGRPILHIGNDGGLFRESFVRRSVTIAPGERADVVVDFAYERDEVVLTNRAPSPFPGGGEDIEIPQIMKFKVGKEPGHTRPIPLELVETELLPEKDAVMTRDFVLEQSSEEECGGRMWTINGKGWGDITEQPHLGTSEIWRFINRSGVMHPMHIHSLFFQVLDRQPFALEGDEMVPRGEPMPPDQPDEGWKDTVKVAPFEIVRVIARFEDFEGRFPYHCHLLEHEDHGMMRQFEAVAVCGDGALARGFEECDDGNEAAGDGCDAACRLENGEGGAPTAPAAPTRAPRPGDCSLAAPGARGSWLLLLLVGLAMARSAARRPGYGVAPAPPRFSRQFRIGRTQNS